MAETAFRPQTFEEMRERSGMIRAMNAYFSVHQNLPEEKVKGEYWEALGDPQLDEAVESWIKSNCSR
jgi:hypothetical protein